MLQFWVCRSDTCIGSTTSIWNQISEPWCFSQTDSLIYEIESDDLYEDLKNNQAVNQEYDFSNYAEDNPLYNKHQKLETLKFKDEMGGKIIHSIIALKSKLYSVSMGDKQKRSAKGTTKYAQKSLHSVFYRILTKDSLLRTLNYTINSERRKIFTLQTSQISLSCFDDKRYILPNGVDTLPYGHWTLHEDVIIREVSGDIEWGNEVLQEKKNEEGVQPNQTSISTPVFAPPPPPPDPGCFQNRITDDEIPDVINLEELTDIEIHLPSIERNLFLDMEAIEECYPPVKRVKFDT